MEQIERQGPRIGREGHRILDPREDEVGPTGLLVVEDVGHAVQPRQHQVPPAAVGRAEFLDGRAAEGQGRDGGILGDHRGAGHQGIVGFQDARDQAPLRVEVAHAPAGHGVGLGEGEDAHHPPAEGRFLGRGERRLGGIAEVPVHLVCDDDQPVPLGEGHQFQGLLAGVDRAGGVVGVAVENGCGARRDLPGDGLHVQVEVAFLVQGREARLAARESDHLLIGGVARRGDDHFLTRLGEGEQGGGDGLDRPGGDQDLPVRVVAHSVIGEGFGHLLPQFLEAGRQGVARRLARRHLLGDEVLDHRRGIEVGNSLGQGNRPGHTGGGDFDLLDRRELEGAGAAGWHGVR